MYYGATKKLGSMLSSSLKCNQADSYNTWQQFPLHSCSVETIPCCVWPAMAWDTAHGWCGSTEMPSRQSPSGTSLLVATQTHTLTHSAPWCFPHHSTAAPAQQVHVLRWSLHHKQLLLSWCHWLARKPCFLLCHQMNCQFYRKEFKQLFF